MGTVPTLDTTPLGGTMLYQGKYVPKQKLGRRGVLLLVIGGVLFLTAIGFAVNNKVNATPQHPPAIYGGQCEHALSEATAISEYTGAYVLRELDENGNLGDVAGIPTQVRRVGEQVLVRGPRIELGESVTLVLTATPYDDAATPIILAYETIFRATEAQCLALGAEIDYYSQVNDIIYSDI